MLAIVLLVVIGACTERPPPDRDVPAAGGTAGEGPNAGGPVSSGRIPACTMFVGYSQTFQWYRASFESVVPDERFELLWGGGRAIRSWADPDTWANANLESACATEDPDRIVIDVGVGTDGLGDVGWYASLIRDAVATARELYPGAQIGLQPIVGGPGYRPCPIEDRLGTSAVNASVAAPAVAEAIDDVVAEDPTLFRGPNPQLASCDMYRDALGHLTTFAHDGSVPGQVYAGREIGAFYLAAPQS